MYFLNFLELILLCFQIWVLRIEAFRYKFTNNVKSSSGSCTNIKRDICYKSGQKNESFSKIAMPNFFSHSKQAEAWDHFDRLGMKQIFEKKLSNSCKKYAEMFVCSLYFPICFNASRDEISKEIIQVFPCISFCEMVKYNCQNDLKKNNMVWPSDISCSSLPSDRMCIEHTPVGSKEFTVSCDKGSSCNTGSVPPKSGYSGEVPSKKCGERYLTLKRDLDHTCVARCDIDVMFTSNHKSSVSTLMVAMATVCCLVSATIIFTYYIDRTRFKYPERPVIFISMCYTFYCIAFFIRAAVDPSHIACEQSDHVDQLRSYYIFEGLDNPYCVVVFLILNFFEMSINMWWLVLSFSWVMAASRRWAHEAIDAVSGYFHLVAWALPAGHTITLLTLRKVSGNEFTGLCGITAVSPSSLLGFLIIPRFVAIGLGALFILIGFSSIIRIRRDLKHGGTNIRRMEGLMVKIGLFAIFFVVPHSAAVGCLLYEYLNYESWMQKSMDFPCAFQYGFPQASVKHNKCPLSASIPNTDVLGLGVAGSLLTGILCIIWIWSSKTFASWNRCCSDRWRFKSRKAITNVERPVPNVTDPAIAMGPPRGPLSEDQAQRQTMMDSRRYKNWYEDPRTCSRNQMYPH